MQSFSIKEAFTFAWNTFKKEPWLYGGIALVVIAISFVVNRIAGEMGGMIGSLLSLVAVLIQWWVYLAFARIALAAHAGQPVSFKMLTEVKWDTYYKFALAMILSGIIVFIGLVLLIVPGIIAQLMLSMVVFVALEKHMGVIDMLKESRRLTDGHKWTLFGFMLIVAVMNIIGALIFGIGLLVTVPLTILAMAHVYKKLDQRVQVEPVAKPMPAPAAPAAPAAPMAPEAPAQM